MSIGDVSFVVGPLGAMVVAPLAIIALVVRQPRRAAWLGAPLMAVLVVSWVGFWYVWGKAFDYADANKPVPTAVDSTSNAFAGICALACVALVVTALTTLRSVRRVDGLPRLSA
ncbi:hypothetical protein ACWDWO_21355 [Actinopolymorpha singaporensis]|uniref:Uncharacterized protein n=1 Tax=Actinopolymorpha singaporensis TaxID=117157 RepID=A0A1H1P8S3_9ACTN|nr:hypothetical protein [Actinopolymorpha singaporensis]SDS07460.1 hypothetical protein SAMN04489717_1534 [Actinopolymorpha singaporensis]